MNSTIKVEEAALADFKRTSTKMWMGLKFGGLVECCEKGAVSFFHPPLSPIVPLSLLITSPIRLRGDSENWSLL